ncbi:dimethylsulfoniopropionate demethylase [Amylibacter sp.]|jgi:dimethylsulfoniopropionate demethylase|nr:dimethylsulfoniopropionate demethylase [Amylibacter sp.]MDA9229440.1 dimethylsulfoniopropionate demethylase [Amylibacter sp.]MDB4100163.1 dimethylsulfoniopropionate demethylase [Amylibacter sp.]MDB4145434.1 dimethylsulfoniopropionate demethylase [Amylibacter sp.]MDB4248167.1 dimethylsulfoniopropionate demethylase [Amylibacter sp.]|tara:strand:- start:5071 stop:6204 length:1134 start_codon:yes stop_codon:yes gene_type:complete
MSGSLLFPSRRLRATPFTSRVSALGVTGYTVYNHMLLATVFESLQEDYKHLKEYVQIWDVSVERQVQLLGPDAHKLACMISARDLTNAKVGRCYYAPICDQNGAIINDPIALRLAENKYWFSISDSDLLLWVQGIAIGLGLNVDICEPDVSPLAIQGPFADDLMADVFGEEIREVKFFHFKAFSFRGHMLNIARSGWSKQGGFEIYLDDTNLGEELWDAIWAKGKKYNIRAGCPNLIERVEAGLLSYGNDMNREDTPLEIGLEKYVSLDSEVDFIGKAALQKQRKVGIKKRLMGIEIDGSKMPPLTMPKKVSIEGKNVGMITSAVFSPDYGGNIGFAMIKASNAYVGAEVMVDSEEGPQRGILCEIGDLWAQVQSNR